MITTDLLVKRIEKHEKALDLTIKAKEQAVQEGAPFHVLEHFHNMISIFEEALEAEQALLDKLQEEERCCIRFDEPRVVPTKRRFLNENQGMFFQDKKFEGFLLALLIYRKYPEELFRQLAELTENIYRKPDKWTQLLKELPALFAWQPFEFDFLSQEMLEKVKIELSMLHSRDVEEDDWEGQRKVSY